MNAPVKTLTEAANLSAGTVDNNQTDPAMMPIAAAILRNPVYLSTAVVAIFPPLSMNLPIDLRANDADLPTFDHLNTNSAMDPIRAVIAAPLKSIFEIFPITLSAKSVTVSLAPLTVPWKSSNAFPKVVTNVLNGPNSVFVGRALTKSPNSLTLSDSMVPALVRSVWKNVTIELMKFCTLSGNVVSSGTLPVVLNDSMN